MKGIAHQLISFLGSLGFFGSAALALATALSACKKTSPPPAEPLRVAAAADLALAFKEVADAFETTTGKKVELAFGSTGMLAKQIEQGAPFDVFAAANVSYADDVVKAGPCDGASKHLYARGRIVVWAKDASRLPARLEDLADAKYAKIAIANPEHAPYGRAAEQALTSAGVLAKVKPRLVFGENVQQALMFAESGNAEVALVALSLASRAQGRYLAIDPALHEPLDQAIVTCKGKGAAPRAEAQAFLDFVREPRGRAIMRTYGFLLPGESLPAQ